MYSLCVAYREALSGSVWDMWAGNEAQNQPVPPLSFATQEAGALREAVGAGLSDINRPKKGGGKAMAFPKLNAVSGLAAAPVFALETDGVVSTRFGLLVDPACVAVYYDECSKRGLRATIWSGNHLDSDVRRLMPNATPGTTVRAVINVYAYAGHGRMRLVKAECAETESDVKVVSFDQK